MCAAPRAILASCVMMTAGTAGYELKLLPTPASYALTPGESRVQIMSSKRIRALLSSNYAIG